MSPFQRALRQVVARSPAGWSEEDIRQAVRVGERLMVLLARQAAGEDVAEDLATVVASSKNIAARATVGPAKAFHEALVGAVAEVSSKLLIAAL